MTGTRRSPFAAIIPICSGKDAGSLILVHFNNNTGSLTGKGAIIRKTVCPVSMTVRKLENENSAYFTYIYCLDKLGLMRRSCMKVLEAWDLHHRVDPDRATVNKVTVKIEHKGLDIQDMYLAKAEQGCARMSIDIKDNNLFNIVCNIKKVDKEKEITNLKHAEEENLTAFLEVSKSPATACPL